MKGYQKLHSWLHRSEYSKNSNSTSDKSFMNCDVHQLEPFATVMQHVIVASYPILIILYIAYNP